MLNQLQCSREVIHVLKLSGHLSKRTKLEFEHAIQRAYYLGASKIVVHLRGLIVDRKEFFTLTACFSKIWGEFRLDYRISGLSKFNRKMLKQRNMLQFLEDRIQKNIPEALASLYR